MSGYLSNARHGLIASILLLAMASAAAAQSIIDSRRIEFTPSGDLAALDVRTGTPLIQNYRLDIYRAGDATVAQSVNLGTPAADPDGMIRVDFVSLLATPLPTGVIFEAVVNGISPSGSISSNRSNTFSFSADCTVSIAPPSANFSTAAAGNGTVAVTAGASCAWRAATESPWITITAGAFGTGNDTVSYMVAANTAPAPRTGTLTIAGQTFTVTQAGTSCGYLISPSSSTLAASIGASGSVAVTAAAGCSWTAVSNSPWISVYIGATGTGNGSVAYSVQANTTSSSRTGSLTIAGSTFTVTQPGAPCGFSLSPSMATLTSPAAATGTVAVATGSGCAWAAVSNVPWITISSGNSGAGNGSLTYSVIANTGTLSRTGTMTIAGKTFTVTQPATSCTFAISPGGQAFTAAGGTATVTVTTSTGCSWSASSGAAWVVISGGAPGTGPGTVSYNVAANSGSFARSAIMTIAGKTFTVTEASGTCMFTVTPSLITAPPAGTSGTITVSTQPGCTWAAASNYTWITVSGWGTGSGTVSYAVQPNAGTIGRSGLISIAGGFVGVSQAAGTSTSAALK
jgi:polyisoprenoid-binding protein YceI